MPGAEVPVQIRPAALPRSLDPLPGESLVGFLLRLAHRLETSPARILERAGFAGTRGRQDTSAIPHHVMLQLTPRERDGLALAARLTPQEAEALCFDQLRSRFPLPPPATGRQTPAFRFDWWLNTMFSRYCPQCLAGDGSPIQDDHGGPWKRAWRLPVVFACEMHNRLLDHRCPACGHLALGVYSTRAGTLVPGMSRRGLHPAQCRAHSSTAHCGRRFDAADAAAAPPGEILELQSRLTALLQPDGPVSTLSAGEPCSPQQYFTDLRLMSYLAVTTWPRTRHLAPSDQLAQSVDQLAGHQGPAGENLPRTPVALARPADAGAAACLLFIADQLLLGHTAAVRDAIRALLPHWTDPASSTGWRLSFRKADQTAYSPGFSAAVWPAVSRDRWIPGKGRRRQPELQAQFGPEHVPQHLPEEWLRRHLGTSVTAVPIPALQRFTTTRLVQMLAGGSRIEATIYLGFPNPPQRTQILAKLPATAGLTPIRRADERFDELIQPIVGELAARKPINYQARRIALSSWELDEDTWQRLVTEARARTDGRHLSRWPHDPVDRLLASVSIWQRVTSGFYRYAPLLKSLYRYTAPLLETPSSNWHQRSDHITFEIMTGRASSPFSIELQRSLNAYADDLAARIDSGDHPGRCPRWPGTAVTSRLELGVPGRCAIRE